MKRSSKSIVTVAGAFGMALALFALMRVADHVRGVSAPYRMRPSEREVWFGGRGALSDAARDLLELVEEIHSAPTGKAELSACNQGPPSGHVGEWVARYRRGVEVAQARVLAAPGVADVAWLPPISGVGRREMFERHREWVLLSRCARLQAEQALNRSYDDRTSNIVVGAILVGTSDPGQRSVGELFLDRSDAAAVDHRWHALVCRRLSPLRWLKWTAMDVHALIESLDEASFGRTRAAAHSLVGAWERETRRAVERNDGTMLDPFSLSNRWAAAILFLPRLQSGAIAIARSALLARSALDVHRWNQLLVRFRCSDGR